MSKAATEPPKITSDDLRATFQSFQDGITGKIESKRTSLLATGGGVLLILLLLFFVLGKRSGKKQTTLVEIRRL